MCVFKGKGKRRGEVRGGVVFFKEKEIGEER